MKASCVTVSYEKTGYFSRLATDYLKGVEALRPFYSHTPGIEGIKASIEARNRFEQNRELLVRVLKEQYNGIEITAALQQNLDALLSPDCYTVTTAHQPNIYTGPLYFIYKILHAIKLAEFLRNEIPGKQFVPVYYMGSEDADLDELGHIFLSGEKVEWNTKQTGAVGRMNTKGLEQILNRLQGEFGHLPHAQEMIALCKEAYTKNANIQQATLYLVNRLFGQFGLVVLVPDNALLKSAFIPVLKKELFERFSYPLVQETAAAMEGRYKVQTSGREINLFYLSDDGSRDRIEYIHAGGEEKWQVINKDLVFTKDQLLQELEAHAERFSPNVILRGVFQETVLPNVAFIGGGGELAYWMELKKVFTAAEVPFPVLLLRNSFLLIEESDKALQDKLKLDAERLFIKKDLLLEEYAVNNASASLDTKKQQQEIFNVYRELQEQASAIDPTLKAHVAALHAGTLKGMMNLEKKFLRAEKRKQSEYSGQLQKLKSSLFPQDSLQERIDNFMPFYAKYGNEILDILYRYSQPFAEEFSVLNIGM